jgi:hypothetical protein
MLLGLAGPKRSGKSTVAAHLRERFGFVEDSFAAPLRQFVASILGLTLTELEAAKEWPVPWLGDVTPRSMMQTVGTEWGRQMVHPDLWIRSAMRRAEGARGRGAPLVFSDVRFENEALAIQQAGGRVIRMTGRGELGDGHASEIALAAQFVDFEIRNDGDFASLYDQVEHLLHRIADA